MRSFIGLLLALSITSCVASKDSGRDRLTSKQGREAVGEGDELREALWVYQNEVHRVKDQHRLLLFALNQGINTLYLNVYQPSLNAEGRRMYDEEKVSRFIRKAHYLGIEVWAAYGAVSWQRYKVRPGEPPYERMQEVIAYNRAHPKESFDGVMFNLEPPEPVDLARLIDIYQRLTDVLQPRGIPAAAALRFFWDREVKGSSRKVRKPAYQHILDMGMDHVVVMAYRNFAGEGCREDGIICLSQKMVQYASLHDNRNQVVVGLRNTSTDLDPGPAKVTFHGQSKQAFRIAKEQVRAYYRRDSGFGGFALHRYRSIPS